MKTTREQPASYHDAIINKHWEKAFEIANTNTANPSSRARQLFNLMWEMGLHNQQFHEPYKLLQPEVKKIFLSAPSFFWSELKLFLQCLPNEMQANLSLRHLRIGASQLESGLKQLSHRKDGSLSESSNKIKKINLSRNQINKEAVTVLVDWMLRVRSIASLDLHANTRIGGGSPRSRSGVQVIAAALKKDNSLQELMLQDTNLNDYDIESLTTALISNETLSHLDISNNPKLTDKIEKILSEFKRKRKATSRLEIIISPTQTYCFGKTPIDLEKLESILKNSGSYPDDIYKKIISLLSDFLDMMSRNTYYMRNLNGQSNSSNYIKNNTEKWRKHFKTKIEDSKSFTDLLNIVENAVMQYQILGVISKDQPVTAIENNAYNTIWAALKSLNKSLLALYENHYWRLCDPAEHEERVIRIFEDAICKTLQLHKTSSRVIEDGCFARKPITKNEKNAALIGEILASILKVTPHVFGFVEFLNHSFQHHYKLVSEALHVAYDEAHVVSEICEKMPFLRHHIDKLLEKYKGVIGSTKLEKRLSDATDYFSGISGQKRSAKSAEYFSGYFREQLVKFSPQMARKFAKHLCMDLKQFLLFGELDLSIENFVTLLQANKNSECIVMLKNGEEVNAYDLLRRPINEIANALIESPLSSHSLFALPPGSDTTTTAIISPDPTQNTTRLAL